MTADIIAPVWATAVIAVARPPRAAVEMGSTIKGLVCEQAPGLAITPTSRAGRYVITQTISGRTVSTLSWELEDAKRAALIVAPLADWTQDFVGALSLEERIKLYVAIVDAWDAEQIPTEHLY